MDLVASRGQTVAFTRFLRPVKTYLSPVILMDFPAGASPTYGNIRAYLQRAGTPIGNYDLLLAAHALFEGLILVTNNTKEFKRVPDLKMEDWIEPDKFSVRAGPRR